MSTKVPGTLRELVASDVLTSLDETLGPPIEHRVRGRYEVEVESAGEGAFVFRFDDGVLSARKGFATGDPFLSCAIPKGGFSIVQQILEAALSGFVESGLLQSVQRQLRSLTADEFADLIDAIEGVEDLAIETTIAGVGAFSIARGALDEVSRTVRVEVPKAAIDDVLHGRGVQRFQSAKVSGDRMALTELVRALKPLSSRLAAVQELG